MLLAIAIIPGLIILGFVWFKDPIEKENPILLASLFGMGALSCIPAIVLEEIGTGILDTTFVPDTMIYNALEMFLVVGLAEELCKFFFLRVRTWKNSEFNYLFDAIVYAVFVSLGFAVLENIGYVTMYGFETGIARAFTSLPGHTTFAVFMGYFYAQAKLAEVQGNKEGVTRNLVLSLAVPILAHGAYDFFASMGLILEFFALITVMFITGLVLILRESKAATQLYSTAPTCPYPTQTVPGMQAPTMQGAPGAPMQTQAPLQCPHCRSWLIPGARFCQNCGTKVQ